MAFRIRRRPLAAALAAGLAAVLAFATPASADLNSLFGACSAKDPPVTSAP